MYVTLLSLILMTTLKIMTYTLPVLPYLANALEPVINWDVIESRLPL